MRLILVILLFTSCSFDRSNTSEDGGFRIIDALPITDAVIDGSVELTGFNLEPEKWIIPSSGTIDGFSSTSFATNNQFWIIEDLNFDGILDLVQTMDPQSQKVWESGGVDYWSVYWGESSGFSANSIEWRVPSSGLASGYFVNTKVSGTIGTPGTESWDLQDLNGDGCVDFIRLLDPTTGLVWSDVNGSYWEVYICSTEGFAEVPLAWRLPSPLFSRTARNDLSGCWDLVDLTGDGRIDLVHTCGDGVLAPWESPENSHWRLYENNSDGFSSTLQEWTIPNNESSLGFFRVDSNRGGRFWRVLDFDGDGSVELVQPLPYRTNIDPFVFGNNNFPIWKKFSSTPSGFSTLPVEVTVPVTEHVGGFFSLGESSSLNGVHWYWTSMDINNDGILDLIQTADSTEGTAWGVQSSPFWKVYFGSSNNSFDMNHSVWTLPESGENPRSGFFTTKAEGWELLDIDGDGQVELIQTQDPNSNAVWSDSKTSSYWKIFRRI